MKIADARAWLIARSSRVRIQSGEVVVGIPLDMAKEIADLLKVDSTPAPEYGLIPMEVVIEPTPEPEYVVDTESGPVKMSGEKVAKKKKAKKRRKR